MIVIDASAGFELITDTSAGAAIREKLKEAESIVAPDLFISEVANVCWKAVRREAISAEDAVKGLRFILSLIDRIVPAQDMAVEALSQACLANHSVYDLMYLTLAKREAAKLLTLDQGMMKLAKRLGVKVA